MPDQFNAAAIRDVFLTELKAKCGPDNTDGFASTRKMFGAYELGTWVRKYEWKSGQWFPTEFYFTFWDKASDTTAHVGRKNVKPKDFLKELDAAIAELEPQWDAKLAEVVMKLIGAD